MQQNRADTLRRRIELYRRLLSKGVDADLARVYLFEIGEAELELAELQRRRMTAGRASPFRIARSVPARAQVLLSPRRYPEPVPNPSPAPRDRSHFLELNCLLGSAPRCWRFRAGGLPDGYPEERSGAALTCQTPGRPGAGERANRQGGCAPFRRRAGARDGELRFGSDPRSYISAGTDY
jgi:hypothetical protein